MSDSSTAYASSVIQPVGGIGQLLAGAFRVPGGRVQVFVAEDLRQRHQVVVVVGQELVSHRVPQQMGVQLDADEGRILVANGSAATLRQRPPLTDEPVLISDWWAARQICFEGTA